MKGIGTLYAPQRYRTTMTGNLVRDICHQSWVYSIPKKICQAAGFQRGERSSMIQGRSRDKVNSKESGKKEDGSCDSQFQVKQMVQRTGRNCYSQKTCKKVALFPRRKSDSWIIN